MATTYVIDVLGQTVGHGLCLHEQTVVLVGRLGQTHLVRLLSDSFTVGHHGIGLLDWNASMVLLQVLDNQIKINKDKSLCLTSFGNCRLS